LTADATLTDWAPLTDYENLDVKWHIPSDEETECAIELFKTAANSKLQRIRELIASPEDGQVVKVSGDWTDELRESLKYLVSAMLAAIPLYQRCSPPEEWEVKPSDVPDIPAPLEMIESEDELMDVDQPDVEDDEGNDDDDEDFSDADAAAGRSQKYADGFINRPLKREEHEILSSIYIDIGCMLSSLHKYLWANRQDDMQAFIELSATDFCWLHPQGMATMNDIRMEVTSSAISNIRRAAFVVKGLGKAYYPEAILIQRVEGMHRERVSHNFAVKPARTWWQDAIIRDVVGLTVSPYIDARRYLIAFDK
jgi:hypothetical protein